MSCGLSGGEEKGGAPNQPPLPKPSDRRVQRTRLLLLLLVRVPVCACVRNEAKFLTYLGERVRETASSSSLQSPGNRAPLFFSTPFDAPTWGSKAKKNYLAEEDA